MRLELNVSLSRAAKAAGAVAKQVPSNLSTLWSSAWSWLNVVREPFSGGWQRGVEIDAPGTILSFSAVFACVTGISGDIAKLPAHVVKRKSSGVWVPDLSHWGTKLLRKPNHFQIRIRFITQWIISKLLWGNAYVLKKRKAGGPGYDALYVLDPRRVKVLLATSGEVFYELASDDLAGLQMKTVTVPATEIIHDTMITLWHPLVGISPISACGLAATMGNRILQNSSKFFGNASRPSGILTAPGAISDETAGRLKQAWEENFSGSNIGRLAVLGDGLEYNAMTIPAHDAQLIEQLRWTVEDVARAFHYPLYKLGGAAPSYNNIEALSQMYLSDCLQLLIESLEASLDDGLGMEENEGFELDLENLLRMDSPTRYERNNKAVAGGWLAPNEARLKENLEPVTGGDSPMMQQQNWTLTQLAERKAPVDSSSVAPPPPPAPAPGDPPAPAEPEDGDEDDVEENQMAEMFARELIDGLVKMKTEKVDG